MPKYDRIVKVVRCNYDTVAEELQDLLNTYNTFKIVSILETGRSSILETISFLVILERKC